MAEKNPTVSVITTAYTVAEFISDAITSVLAQDFHDFEYIIVDDASTDDSFDVAASYAQRDRRIRLYRNESNLGDYPNRKHAASLARGDFIKFVDADNYLYPHALSVMVSCMERYPSAGLGLCKVHGSDRPLPDCLAPQEAYRMQFFGSGLFTNAPTSTIFRRACYEKVGGFNAIRHRGDFDLWLRMGAVAATVRIPAYLDWDRVRPGQESQQNKTAKAWITHGVATAALKAPDCPLGVGEARAALQRYERNFAINTLRRMLKREISVLEYHQIRSRTGLSEIRALASLLKSRMRFAAEDAG